MGGRQIGQGARVFAALALGWGISLAGCGGGGGGDTGGSVAPPPPPADTTAPTISDAALAPTALGFVGGRVTVSAKVADTSGVSRVWMVVTQPDGNTATVDLAAGADQAYTATWSAPENSVVGAPDRVYSVQLQASDTAGNTATGAAMTFTVQAIEAPPPIPL